MRLELDFPAELVEAIAQRAAELVRADSVPTLASPYLTVVEAAEYLRCGRQRIYDLLSSRRLTRFKDGSRVLLERKELDRLVAQGLPTVSRGRVNAEVAR